MGNKYKRTRLWINAGLQLRMAARMAGYVAVYALVLCHLGFLFHALHEVPLSQHPGSHLGTLYLNYLKQQAPLWFAFCVVLPALFYDLLKYSNRIAGPLHRCGTTMLEMASGKPVPEFRPRKGDELMGFFKAFNALIREWNARLESGRAGPSSDAGVVQAKSSSSTAVPRMPGKTKIPSHPVDAQNLQCAETSSR
jgi:hypothetical protein